MNHNTKESSLSGKQEPTNLGSHEHKSAPSVPSNVQEALLSILWRTKRRYLVVFFLVVIMGVFAVWCSLPETWKMHFMPSFSHQQDRWME